MMKCLGEGCTNTKAFAFRKLHDGPPLCDECWGQKYGDFTCIRCEYNCYEGDFDENTQTYLCGRCQRELQEQKLDKFINADMEHSRHGL